MNLDLPYSAEYSKSGRAACKGCNSLIAKDVLRLAVMVQSPFYDGKTPRWFHAMCFFGKQRPKSIDEIANYGQLRYEDQKMIKEKIESVGSAVVPVKKGKKRDASTANALKDFTIEYSKSSRALCRGCQQKIIKDEVRVAKKDFETEVGRQYGGQDLWHHLSCFAKLRSELGYFESADKLPGFKSLSKADQAEAKKQIPAIKQEEVPVAKKVKKDDTGIEAKQEKQSKIIFQYRDNLKNNLSKTQLTELLTYNKQKVPVGEERILDRLSDAMAFGRLEPCSDCGGQFVYTDLGYVCHGDATEWTKCNKVEMKPKRAPFKVPSTLAQEFPFLKNYKYVSRDRIFREIKPTVSSELMKKEKEDPDGDKPKVERAAPPLYDMQFVILGKLEKGKDELKKEIARLGGKVVTKISRDVMAIISNKDEVEKLNSRMSEAQLEDIHVVPEGFIDTAKNYDRKKIPELVIKMSICNWGSDPNTRMPPSPSATSQLKSKSKSNLFKSKSSKIKLTVKDGGAVDPDSGLQDVAHIYSDNGEKYNTVLGITDVLKNKNSYYKLQLLESDKRGQYWVFRAWGRIGTTIGGNKVEKCDSLFEAKELFENLYEEKSGNMWAARKMFTKMPGKMYPIDIDYGEDNLDSLMPVNTESNLPQPVQNLMKLIFDVKAMKNLMLEFELDTEKMPLGKISKKQMTKAYQVLNELQGFLNSKTELNKIVDATNRFYTLVPHSFGIDAPPLINDEETIKKKMEMLESLMDLEIAYNIMQGTGSDHSVDALYTKLKVDLSVLDQDSEEFSLIKQYVKNTHAQTHASYELELQQVFVVRRHGEDLRYKPFKKLHNRMLLWHGSRLTNFAGILSQGLRIAPPEAPVTGYMFGKGIYFADMVSKSANYCCTTANNPVGLLLLNEVALGNMHELLDAKNIVKPPKGKHSVKGVGATYPDPKETKVLEDGVQVPLGKAINDVTVKGSLLYNEYIVYDVAQVNCRYLLEVKFKYKY